MTDPHRIVLVERPAVLAERSETPRRVRHYRIARLRLAQRREEIAPRHAHLRETYD